MESPRDRAVHYAQRLFKIIFQRMWLPFGPREEQIVARLVDFIIQAAAEQLASEQLDDLLDEQKPVNRFQTVKLSKGGEDFERWKAQRAGGEQ